MLTSWTRSGEISIDCLGDTIEIRKDKKLVAVFPITNVWDELRNHLFVLDQDYLTEEVARRSNEAQAAIRWLSEYNRHLQLEKQHRESENENNG